MVVVMAVVGWCSSFIVFVWLIVVRSMCGLLPWSVIVGCAMTDVGQRAIWRHDRAFGFRGGLMKEVEQMCASARLSDWCVLVRERRVRMAVCSVGRVSVSAGIVLGSLTVLWA